MSKFSDATLRYVDVRLERKRMLLEKYHTVVKKVLIKRRKDNVRPLDLCYHI